MRILYESYMNPIFSLYEAYTIPIGNPLGILYESYGNIRHNKRTMTIRRSRYIYTIHHITIFIIIISTIIILRIVVVIIIMHHTSYIIRQSLLSSWASPAQFWHGQLTFARCIAWCHLSYAARLWRTAVICSWQFSVETHRNRLAPRSARPVQCIESTVHSGNPLAPRSVRHVAFACSLGVCSKDSDTVI